MIDVYTDGACWPNPGTSGGWGFVAYQGDTEIYADCGPAVGLTTNNQMEITAVLKALQWLGSRPARLHTDSSYVVNGLNGWCRGWERKGWMRQDKKTKRIEQVPNAALWQLAMLHRKPCHSLQWVRGHNGNAGNERADELAEMGRHLQPV